MGVIMKIRDTFRIFTAFLVLGSMQSAFGDCECVLSKTEAFMHGSATGALGATIGQYFAANRTARQLNYPAPGFKNAYRGLFTNVFGAMPIVAVQSTANNAIKSELVKMNSGSELSKTQKGIASVGAGLVSSSIVSPLGNLWIAQQQPHNKNKSAFAALKDIYTQRGLAGFYRGITPTLLKQATRSTALLAAYPTVNKEYCRLIENDTAAACATGFTVGPVMALVTHPLDTIETRMQNDSAKTQYKTMWHALKDSIRTKSLWNGWRWQLAGSVVNSIAMGSFQQWLAQKNKQ